MLVIASSILTLAGLVGLGVGGGLAYMMLVLRRNTSAPTAAPQRGRISLRDVVDRLVCVGDDEMTLLDCTSGRFVTLGDELRAALETGDELEDDDDFSREELEKIRSKLRGRALLPLPTKAETKEFLLRERFCDELPEGEVKEQMLKVLRAQTGFRSFDGAVQRLGIADQWHRRRDGEFARIAIAWLERHGIPFDPDVPAAA